MRVSNGRPPRFLNQATRTPLKPRSRFPANVAPGSVIEIGHRGSGPAITLSRSAASAAVRAIGPETLSVDQALARAPVATRPRPTRKPLTLQHPPPFPTQPPPP